MAETPGAIIVGSDGKKYQLDEDGEALRGFVIGFLEGAVNGPLKSRVYLAAKEICSYTGSSVKQHNEKLKATLERYGTNWQKISDLDSTTQEQSKSDVISDAIKEVLSLIQNEWSRKVNYGLVEVFDAEEITIPDAPSLPATEPRMAVEKYDGQWHTLNPDGQEVQEICEEVDIKGDIARYYGRKQREQVVDKLVLFLTRKGEKKPHPKHVWHDILLQDQATKSMIQYLEGTFKLSLTSENPAIMTGVESGVSLPSPYEVLHSRLVREEWQEGGTPDRFLEVIDAIRSCNKPRHRHWSNK